MGLYRKKPVVIEAKRFIDLGADMFMEYRVRHDKGGAYLIIPTLEGDLRANDGDWVVTGVNQERYPIKPDIFEKTYEPVGATSAESTPEQSSGHGSVVE